MPEQDRDLADDRSVIGAGGIDSEPVPVRSFRSSSSSHPVLASEALHGLAGEVVRTIAPHSEAADVALLVQFLVAFGNVIGRNPYQVIEADRHYTNLYAVLVGETSKARKGTSWGQIRRLFAIVEDDWTRSCVASGLSSGEGLIWAVRDPVIGVSKKNGRDGDEHAESVVDAGVADKRLLVQEPEFASVLRAIERQGNTLSPIVREAWDSGTLRTMVKNAPAHATDAHISIIGHITRDELVRYMHRTEAANGFANRFLFVAVRRSKALPRGGDLSDAVVHALAARVGAAITAARQVREVSVSEAAWRTWDAVYEPLSDGRPGLLGAVTSRAEAQVRRLAMLYALLDHCSAIRRVHMLAALAVWDYCQASAARIFGDALGDPVADDLYRALGRAGTGGLTRTEIRNLFGRNRGADEIDHALGVLLDRGLGRMGEDHETGGRPAERWFATNVGTIKTTETTEGVDDAAKLTLSSFKSFPSYLDLALRADVGNLPPQSGADALSSAPYEREPGEEG